MPYEPSPGQPPYGYGEPPGGYAGPPGSYGGQQGGYVGPPGYGPPPQPRKRTGLVVGVVIGVLVLVGAGIGAYFVFFAKSGQNSANATPQQVVTGFAQSYTSLAHSLSTDDLTKVKSYLCATDQTAVQAIYDHEKSANGADKTFTMTASNAATTGTTGSFTLVITDHGNKPESHKGNLVRQNSQWLVCNTLSTPN
jgi:Tfp pilus assembly protein PilE